mmetsp:Transcript_30091/g.93090  ORF Transcript_30091/g.93090 Transcript_30091/m.93090 type:complete len:157 (-) Transcript_30091:433-903(-)
MAQQAIKRIVVFGGNGFVGSTVLRHLAAIEHVAPVSVSRGGAMPPHAAPFGDKVDWRAGDCLEPSTYSELLEGAAAVVLSVGTPPLPGASREANGASNARVLEAAAAADVPRAVLVNATMPAWLGAVGAGGYADGGAETKRSARCLQDVSALNRTS